MIAMDYATDVVTRSTSPYTRVEMRDTYHVFDRIAIRDVFDDVGSKYVPPHVNIFYCFGVQDRR